MKTFKIDLDMVRQSKGYYLELVEDDYGSSQLEITIQQEGRKYDLTDVTGIEIPFKKPDGHIYVHDLDNGVEIADAAEGKITCTVSTQALDTPGLVYFEVRVMRGLAVSTSVPMRLYVRRPIINDSSITAMDRYPVLQTLIIQCQAITDEEAVRVQQEAERQQNEELRQQGEANRNNAYELAETARDNAYNAKEQERDGKYDDAELARDNAYQEKENERDGKYEEAEEARYEDYGEAENARDNAYNAKELERDGLYADAESARNNAYNNKESERDGLYAAAESQRDDWYRQAEEERDDLYAAAEALRDAKLNIFAMHDATKDRKAPVPMGHYKEISGYGHIDIPSNANGQVSVSVFGNTELDELGNAKSTVSAMRLRSVGKNLFDESKLESVNSRPTLVWDGKVLSLYDYANFMPYDHPFVKYVRSLLKVGHTYTSTRTVERLSGDSGVFGAIWFYNDTYGYFEVFTLGDGDRKKTFTVPEDFFEKWGTSRLIIYGTSNGTGERVRISRLQIEESSTATPYEPYIESNAYVVAKDEEGNIAELRSLPNGTKDEFRVSENKLIKRIGDKTNVASGTVINYVDMADGGQYYAWNNDGETETGIKGDTLGIDATSLNYQLATPIEKPIQVSGSLVSYPSGTVYIEPFVTDAGIYTDKMEVLYSDLPIKALEKISKVDFNTGLETELDITAAVIAEDKLSFTHPNLTSGDIVFFVYEHGAEGTIPETEISYYDSRYVIKGEDDKFYQWEIEAKLVEGVITPSIKLVEV